MIYKAFCGLGGLHTNVSDTITLTFLMLLANASDMQKDMEEVRASDK